jgi:hypothetical protein
MRQFFYMSKKGKQGLERQPGRAIRDQKEARWDQDYSPPIEGAGKWQRKGGE